MDSGPPLLLYSLLLGPSLSVEIREVVSLVGPSADRELLPCLPLSYY